MCVRVRPPNAKNARRAEKNDFFCSRCVPQLRRDRDQTTTNSAHIKIEYNLRDIAFGDVLMMLVFSR